jgi:beta-lactamase family protein
MGQFGLTKRVVVVACLVVVAGYYLGYRSVHSIAQHVAHNRAVAQQQAAEQARAQKAAQLKSNLETAWRNALTATPPDGNVDVAVYDSATGATAHYTNAPSGTTYNTASIIKLSILETLLWQNQQNGIAQLTSSQSANAMPMIEQSDNDAATALWGQVGKAPAINSFFSAIGATSSTAGQDWGLTQTTAPDQLKVVNEVAYPGKLLTDASAQQADALLDHVEAGQHWGVSGGVSAGVSVRLKNGWLQGDGDDFNGWVVNSVGHVSGNGADYTIAVLTAGDKTEQHGINTIQALSAAAWNAVSATAKG